MAGIDDRVQGFLKSWPIIEKHLNEILQEAIKDGDSGMVELKGGLQAFKNVHADSVQTFEREIPAAGTPVEGDLEIQPD